MVSRTAARAAVVALVLAVAACSDPLESPVDSLLQEATHLELPAAVAEMDRHPGADRVKSLQAWWADAQSKLLEDARDDWRNRWPSHMDEDEFEKQLSFFKGYLANSLKSLRPTSDTQDTWALGLQNSHTEHVDLAARAAAMDHWSEFAGSPSAGDEGLADLVPRVGQEKMRGICPITSDLLTPKTRDGKEQRQQRDDFTLEFRQRTSVCSLHGTALGDSARLKNWASCQCDPRQRKHGHLELSSLDIAEGTAYPLHFHEELAAYYTLEGHATFFMLNKGELDVWHAKKGHWTFVPANVPHAITTPESHTLTLLFSEGSCGSECDEAGCGYGPAWISGLGVKYTECFECNTYAEKLATGGLTLNSILQDGKLPQDDAGCPGTQGCEGSKVCAWKFHKHLDIALMKLMQTHAMKGEEEKVQVQQLLKKLHLGMLPNCAASKPQQPWHNIVGLREDISKTCQSDKPLPVPNPNYFNEKREKEEKAKKMKEEKAKKKTP